MSLQAELDKIQTPRLQAEPLKVMTLDLERLPGSATVPFWGLNDYKGRRLRHDYVTEWPRTICVAWRWYGNQRTEFASEWGDGAAGMLEAVWRAYDQADVIYGHNVERFDTRHLNSGWRDLGLPPPSPYKIVDTLAEARKVFGDESMTLGALTQRLGIETKNDRYDADVARAAVAGDKAAQRKITRYCKGDVGASEAFVDRLRGWIPSHPHNLMGEATDVPTCNQCWGPNLEPNGWKLAQQMRYPLFRCQDCGGQVQGRKGVRVSDVRPVR